MLAAITVFARGVGCTIAVEMRCRGGRRALPVSISLVLVLPLLGFFVGTGPAGVRAREAAAAASGRGGVFEGIRARDYDARARSNVGRDGDGKDEAVAARLPVVVASRVLIRRMLLGLALPVDYLFVYAF